MRLYSDKLVRAGALTCRTFRTGGGGSTYEETERLMREAMDIHLASMRADGDPIPEPTTRIGTVTVDFRKRKLAKSA